MKRLFPLMLIVVLTHCGQKKDLHMTGAYSMKKQVQNDGSKDTVITRNQLKIYTDDHVIYAAMRLPDSLASYGIGTYDIEDGKVVEHFFYTSARGNSKDTFVLKIEKSDSGYTQVIDDVPSQGKTYRLTEDYQMVGGADSTPLDGAWKQVKNISIRNTGDSTIDPVTTQFKVYQNGNFIWAASIPDTATKRSRTFFGFGRFEMEGGNRAKETNMLSTYPPLIDSTVNVDLEFLGKDSYKQTIVWPSNNKSVEIYERLKK